MLLLLLLVNVIVHTYINISFIQAALKYKIPAVAMEAAYSTAKLEQLWYKHCDNVTFILLLY